MSEHLVLLDTDKIHRYVYSAGTLKSIRGASSILAELNEEKAVKKRVESHGGECIFAGGGQVMAEFYSDKEADEFISDEQAEYKKRDASIRDIKEEYTDADGFKDVVKHAQIKLRRAKEERSYETHLLSSPFFKTCQLCGVNPASKTKYENFVCTSCGGKMERGEKIREDPKESSIYAKFLDFVKGQPAYQEWKKAIFTEHLSELGTLSNPKNYLGLIYADGNRIGERLLDRKSKTEYRELSRAIENGLQDSVFESLLKYIPEPIEGTIPFEFVILGGDDLILFTPAQKAIPIALEILKQFEQKMKKCAEEIEEGKFTLSAGVVIAHSKFPISSFTKQAESLLKSAKTLNKKMWYGADKSPKKEISTIDYLVISSPSANPVEVIREKELTYKLGENTYTLTQRPFTLEKADKIVKIVKEDIKKSEILSRSRFYSLYDDLHKGKNQSILNVLSLVTRLKGKEQKAIKKLFTEMRTNTLLYPDGGALFPWNAGEEYDTPILDMLELYDFIEEDER